MSSTREDRLKEQRRAEEYLESKGWKKSEEKPGFWMDPKDPSELYLFQGAWNEQYAREQQEKSR